MTDGNSSPTTPGDDNFLATLQAWAHGEPDVVGLVLCGSSADQARRDRWSDHDFLVVTRPGRAEAYRADWSWLPWPTDVAFAVRDTAHGLKALYRNGLLIEFAVFDREEFDDCVLNHYAVVVDRDGIAEQAALVRARSTPPPSVDRVAILRCFLSSIYVGTGRVRRGERVSGGLHLRSYAVGHLLRLAYDLIPPDARGQLDVLDPARRIERGDAGFAAALDDALARPVEDVGLALLAVMDELGARRWPQYTADETALVRELLARP